MSPAWALGRAVPARVLPALALAVGQAPALPPLSQLVLGPGPGIPSQLLPQVPGGIWC